MNSTYEKKTNKRCYNCLQLSDCWYDHGPEYGVYCADCEIGNPDERRKIALRLFKVLSRLLALSQNKNSNETKTKEKAELEDEKRALLAQLGK